MKANVLFVVQGEGRGHMTQAIALRQLLEKNDYKVCGVIVGTSERRNIPEFFLQKFTGVPVERVQSPNFITKNNRGINIGATMWHNFKRLKTYFRSAKKIREKVAELNPDMIINFYEPLVGLYTKITRSSKRPPIVSIAHQYLGGHSEFEFPEGHALDRIFLKKYTSLTSSGSSRILALSFDPLREENNELLKVVPPLLRDEIKKLEPHKGGFFLCYLVNSGYRDDIESWHKKNPGVLLHVFTDSVSEKEFIEVHENLFFHKLSDTKFLEYMAGCNGLISSAGFESVCEAFYLDKPVFMVPVEGHFEQLCNGLDATRAGAGIYDSKFEIGKFMEWLPTHQSKSELFRKWENKAEQLFMKNFNEVMEKYYPEPLTSELLTA
ncbi:MAG: glycosyl transferase [Bacteroidota bacterium]|nr:glycosyl transferase [Bacteroidota bacterium]